MRHHYLLLIHSHLSPILSSFIGCRAFALSVSFLCSLFVRHLCVTLTSFSFTPTCVPYCWRSLDYLLSGFLLLFIIIHFLLLFHGPFGHMTHVFIAHILVVADAMFFPCRQGNTAGWKLTFININTLLLTLLCFAV